MPFTTKLRLRKFDDTEWMVESPLHYRARNQWFVVPVGFKTDFATVPQFLTWLVPTTGKYTEAAVLHDWLCTRGIELGVVSSRDADGIFRRTMRELGVPPVRRWLMWTGVRWGAVFSKTRRPGVWLDMPRVLLVSLLALPLVVPASVLAILAYVVYACLEVLAVTMSQYGTLDQS